MTPPLQRNTPDNPLRCEREMDARWHKVEDELGLSPTDLLAQSSLDRARRVYRRKGKIYKIVLPEFTISDHLRACSLSREAELLRRCSFTGVPEVTDFEQTSHCEYIIFKQIQGTPLAATRLSTVGLLVLCLRLSVIIFRLARVGISHNDIKEENILVARDGLFLIDFDQAVETGFLRAFFSNLTGISSGRDGMIHGSLVRVIKQQLRKILTPKRVTILKKMLGRYEKEHTLPTLPPEADPQLHTLLAAWKLAQTAAASSPGEVKAYYSLELGEYFFPGERPWIERWNVLQNITSFTDKRILELGCNMGLLSTFLLKEKQAAAALGVDHDPDILRCAEKISAAFDMPLTLKQVDFNDPADWETGLADYRPDIVFALNVLNWVNDKQRLMNFLGRFDEVIFEGHDDLETEQARFEQVGFTSIRLVSITERNRPILHCIKG